MTISLTHGATDKLTAREQVTSPHARLKHAVILNVFTCLPDGPFFCSMYNVLMLFTLLPRIIPKCNKHILNDRFMCLG